jgi:hypothetical protein
MVLPSSFVIGRHEFYFVVVLGFLGLGGKGFMEILFLIMLAVVLHILICLLAACYTSFYL